MWASYLFQDPLSDPVLLKRPHHGPRRASDPLTKLLPTEHNQISRFWTIWMSHFKVSPIDFEPCTSALFHETCNLGLLTRMAISLSQHAVAFQARSIVESFNYNSDSRNTHANLSCLTKFATIGEWQPLHRDTAHMGQYGDCYCCWCSSACHLTFSSFLDHVWSTALTKAQLQGQCRTRQQVLCYPPIPTKTCTSHI